MSMLYPLFMLHPCSGFIIVPTYCHSKPRFLCLFMCSLI